MKYKNMGLIKDKAVLFRVQTAFSVMYDLLLKSNFRITAEYEIEVIDDRILFISPSVGHERFIFNAIEGYCPVKILEFKTYEVILREVKTTCQDPRENGHCGSWTPP